MTDAKREINFQGPVGIGINEGPLTNNAAVVKGDRVGTIHNYASKQSLAEAAAEIQKLLEQLAQTHPTETIKQQNIVADEVIERIEDNPTLKRRVVEALKAIGVEAFIEAIDHSLVNVLRAGLEKFKDPN